MPNVNVHLAAREELRVATRRRKSYAYSHWVARTTVEKSQVWILTETNGDKQWARGRVMDVIAGPPVQVLVKVVGRWAVRSRHGNEEVLLAAPGDYVYVDPDEHYVISIGSLQAPSGNSEGEEEVEVEEEEEEVVNLAEDEEEVVYLKKSVKRGDRRWCVYAAAAARSPRLWLNSKSKLARALGINEDRLRPKG